MDPHSALEIVDSLQAGNLRKECIWSLGRVISGETWNDLGAFLPKLFPEDQIALVNASNATNAKEISLIVRSLEANGIGGEPLIIAKSKLAYAMGKAEPTGADLQLISAMCDREKEAYVNGIISEDPKLALNATLRLAESDPKILTKVAGQLVAALFEKDRPSDTILFISSIDLDSKNREFLISTAFESWLEEEPESASKFIVDMPRGIDRKTVIMAIVSYCKRAGDEEAASKWEARLGEN